MSYLRGKQSSLPCLRQQAAYENTFAVRKLRKMHGTITQKFQDVGDERVVKKQRSQQ